MNKSNMKLIATVVGAALVYLFLSSPEGVALDGKGNIKSVFNQVRAGIQGERFWKNQVKEINAELQMWLDQPRHEAEWNSEIDQMDREFNQSMEQFYRENPDMRPSAAERRVENLRMRAERIEMAENDRFFRKMRLARIAELRQILPTAKSKVK